MIRYVLSRPHSFFSSLFPRRRTRCPLLPTEKEVSSGTQVLLSRSCLVMPVPSSASNHGGETDIGSHSQPLSYLPRPMSTHRLQQRYQWSGRNLQCPKLCVHPVSWVWGPFRLIRTIEINFHPYDVRMDTSHRCVMDAITVVGLSRIPVRCLCGRSGERR